MVTEYRKSAGNPSDLRNVEVLRAATETLEQHQSSPSRHPPDGRETLHDVMHTTDSGEFGGAGGDFLVIGSPPDNGAGFPLPRRGSYAMTSTKMIATKKLREKTLGLLSPNSPDSSTAVSALDASVSGVGDQ
jgi:hypothetical protein